MQRAVSGYVNLLMSEDFNPIPHANPDDLTLDPADIAAWEAYREQAFPPNPTRPVQLPDENGRPVEVRIPHIQRCPECRAKMTFETDYNEDGVMTQPPWWECDCGYRERYHQL